MRIKVIMLISVCWFICACANRAIAGENHPPATSVYPQAVTLLSSFEPSILTIGERIIMKLTIQNHSQKDLSLRLKTTYVDFPLEVLSPSGKTLMPTRESSYRSTSTNSLKAGGEATVLYPLNDYYKIDEIGMYTITASREVYDPVQKTYFKVVATPTVMLVCGSISNACDVTAQLEQPEVARGAPVILTVNVQNASTDELQVISSDQINDFRLLIQSPSGHIVSINDGKLHHTAANVTTLKSEDTFCTRIPVSQLYSLTEPGQYLITAYRKIIHLPHRHEDTIVSNTITLTVTPP